MSLFEKVNLQKQRTEEQLARGGGRSSASFWKPDDGENHVRVMPQWKDDLGGEFWREVAQHWNVADNQRGPVLCPKETPDLKGDCPICDLVQELRMDKSNTEAQKLSKELRAKKTYFLNVVVRKDPVYTAKDVADHTQSRPDFDCPFTVGDPKIQIYACPLTIFDQILGIISTSGKDITNLKDGRDLLIKKFPHKDRRKTRYECYPSLEPTDTGLSDLTLPVLDKVGFELSYDEMIKLIDQGPAADFIRSITDKASSSLPTGDNKSSAAEAENVPASDLAEQMRRELA